MESGGHQSFCDESDYTASLKVHRKDREEEL